jgi:hypothetical protein
MQALVPQLPGRIMRRLRLEAGANVGFISFKATLPGQDNQQSPVALVNAVVRMIEKHRRVLRRTDPTLAPGDWVRFDEEFRYGDSSDSLKGYQHDGPIPALTYFAAAEPPPLVLCGSAAHVLDRRQSHDRGEPDLSGVYYSNAFRRYVIEVFKSTSENALGEPMPLAELDMLSFGVSFICDSAQRERGWSNPVRLAGHARVLAIGVDPAGVSSILATPLYVEYSISKSTGATY